MAMPPPPDSDDLTKEIPTPTTPVIAPQFGMPKWILVLKMTTVPKPPSWTTADAVLCLAARLIRWSFNTDVHRKLLVDFSVYTLPAVELIHRRPPSTPPPLPPFPYTPFTIDPTLRKLSPHFVFGFVFGFISLLGFSWLSSSDCRFCFVMPAPSMANPPPLRHFAPPGVLMANYLQAQGPAPPPDCPTPSTSSNYVVPLPNVTALAGSVRSKFSKALLARSAESLQALLQNNVDLAAIEKETRHVGLVKKIQRTNEHWRFFLQAMGVPESAFYLDTTFEKHTVPFLCTRVHVLSEMKAEVGQVASYGTLCGWATVHFHFVTRYAQDASLKHVGSALLAGRGLYDKVMNECVSLYRQYGLDKYVPQVVYWGRPEVVHLVENILLHDVCMESGFQKIMALNISFHTILQGGALGYSYPEWNGKDGNELHYMQYKDNEVRRDFVRGRGAFILKLTAKHIKGRNGAKVTKAPEFILTCPELEQNQELSVPSWFVVLSFFQGQFVEWRGKTFEEFLDGTDGILEWANPDDPVFCKMVRGGYGLLRGDPISAACLCRSITDVAVRSGLRGLTGKGGSFTSIRKDGATEWADRCSIAVAQEMLVHSDADSTALTHYSCGTASRDVVGIRTGEVKFGDETALAQSRALNLFRSPELQHRALQILKGTAASSLRLNVTGVVEKSTARYQDPPDIQAEIKKQLEENAPVRAALERQDEALERVKDITNLPTSSEFKVQAAHDSDKVETWVGPGDPPDGWGLPATRRERINKYLILKKAYQKLRQYTHQAIARKVRDTSSQIQQAEMKKGDVRALRQAAEERATGASTSRLQALTAPPASTLSAPRPPPLPSDPVPGPSRPPAPSLSVPAPVPPVPMSEQAASDGSPLDDDEAQNLRAAFFLQSVGNTTVERDPLHSRIMSDLNANLGITALQNSSSNSSKTTGKRKRSTKDSKTTDKGKAKASDPRINEEEARVAIDPLQEEGLGEFDEANVTAFDRSRQREIGDSLSGLTPEDIRCNFMRNLLCILQQDKELENRPCGDCPMEPSKPAQVYSRWKLNRHVDRIHLPLETHFPGRSLEDVRAEVAAHDHLDSDDPASKSLPPTSKTHQTTQKCEVPFDRGRTSDLGISDDGSRPVA